MTNLLRSIREGLAAARQDEARRLDRKRTKKALRVNPDAEMLTTQVELGRDMESLVSQGWTVVGVANLAPAGGTSIFNRFTLVKPNPNRLANTP